MLKICDSCKNENSLPLTPSMVAIIKIALDLFVNESTKMVDYFEKATDRENELRIAKSYLEERAIEWSENYWLTR